MLRDISADDAIAAIRPGGTGRRSIAVIGIDRYHQWPRLDNAVNDARGALEAFGRLGFEAAGRPLFDEAATADAIRRLVTDDLAKLRGDDSLVLFFAGHGYTTTRTYDDGHSVKTGFMLPFDAELPEGSSAGWLRLESWLSDVARLAAKHILVFLDCCRSGVALGAAPYKVRGPSPTEALVSLRCRRSRKVITSAMDDQSASDSGPVPGHSLFTGYLLEGLAGELGQHAALVTGAQIGVHLQERVASHRGSRQTPVFAPFEQDDGGELIIELEPPRVDRAAPYRGLSSFREHDSALFFGREAAVRQLVDAIAAQPLTVVVGPAGSGKSSLIHAGAVPALRARGWAISTTRRPGDAPLDALQAVTEELGGRSVGGDPVAAWLALAVERARRDPWLVVIDPLDELVTGRAHHRERATFLDALARAASACPALHLVLSVRSDAEPQLRNGALQARWTRFALPAPSRDQLRAIVEQPASAAGVCFEPAGLVERLIDEAMRAPAPLAALSFAASELYRTACVPWRPGDRARVLRETDQMTWPGIAEALSQRATVLHDELVAGEPAYGLTIRNLFTRLALVPSGVLARCRVDRDDLMYGDPAENLRVAEVVKRFEAAGLITVTADVRAGGRCEHIEAIHDELLTGWSRVGPWLDDIDRPAGARAVLVALGGAVRAWRARDRSDAALWDSPRAALVERIERARSFAFNAHEAEFVQRSVALARRRRARAVTRLVAGRRLLARSYQETGRQLLLAGRPFEALPYLVEARTAGAAGSSLRMLFWAAARQLRTLPLEHGGRVLSARFCGTGARIVTACSDGTAQIWDVAAGTAVGLPLVHEGPVRHAAFSLDGSRAVTASDDGAARIWDTVTGKLVAPPMVHQAGVRSAGFSPDGKRAVTASDDHTARVWDAVTGVALGRTLAHGGPVRSAVFGPDGTRVVSASDDGVAQIWDATTGRVLCMPFTHRGPVYCAAFSLDGRRVVTASEDRTARVWHAMRGTAVSPVLEHRAPVASAAFSPDGAQVVTASEDHTARVWHAITGAPVSAPLAHHGPVSYAGFSVDGTRVVTASDDGTARIWNAVTGDPISPPLEHQGPVRDAGFSPDGAWVVTASEDRTVRRWDTTPARAVALSLAHGAAVESAAFSPDGTTVVTASLDCTATLWDVETGLATVPRLAHRDGVLAASFSADGARVVTASSDRTSRVWNAATGKPLGAALEHGADVRSAAFSPDGARVVTASSDQTARVWDAATGKPASPPLEHDSHVWSAAFSPDGARVVTASNDHTARLWDAATGERVAPPLQHRGAVRIAAFSRDGARIVTASWDNTGQVWDAATGEPVTPALDHHRIVSSAAFSPDGARVVTASFDGTARIWDAATGAPVSRPLVHRDKVWCAAYSADGARIVTASSDRTARVWDAGTGKPLCPPLGHGDEVRHVAFSADGTRILTISEDRIARLWTIPLAAGTVADWIALARRGPYVLSDGILVVRPRSSAPAE